VPDNGLQTTLERLQLIVITGKGGVGKSLITAATGRLLAAEGRKVAMVEVDPRESLHHLLDVPPSGGDMIEVAPRLALQHFEPRTLLDDIVRDKLKVSALVRRVLDSPIHKHFTEGAPGLKETAVFGRVLQLLQGRGPRIMPKPDVVLLDAPATGHGLSLMTAPQLVSEVIESGPVGHLAAEIAGFVSDPSKCGVVVVTAAEEMPVQEAIELLQILDQRLHRRPQLVVVNALYPLLPDDDEDPEDAAGRLWQHRRAVNDRELERLDEHWPGPMIELPLLPIDPGPALVGALSRHLGRQLRSLR
jgi:anion-transporting  ArsA/GET3 family ATPase